MQNFITNWANIAVDKRWFVIAITAIVMALSVLPMGNLYFNNSSELFLLEDDPNRVTYDKFLDRFGEDKFVMIGIEAKPSDKNIFNREALEIIAQLTEFLEEHESITKVVSLSNYQHMTSEDDTMDTVELIDFEDFEFSPIALEGLATIMKGEELALNSLISPDMRHTRIVANTIYEKGKSEHEVKLMIDLQKFLEEQDFLGKGYDLKLFGNAVVMERFKTLSTQDSAWINPLMSLVMIIILFLSFRTLTSMLLPWLVVGGTVLLVVGFQGLMEWPFNTVNTVLPPIIIVMGIGDAVHMLTEFYHFRNLGFNPKQAAKKTVESLWLPCFYTSITTATGFFALSATKLLPIRELGILGGLAALMAFLISVTALPALLSFLSRVPKATQKKDRQGWVAHLTSFLVGFTFQHRKILSIACFFLFIISFALASQITVDTNYVNYFKSDSKLRQDVSYFDRTYNGGTNFGVMIDSGVEGGAKEPEILREVEKLQRFLESFDATGKTASLVDYVKEMNRVMHNNDRAFRIIPDSRELVAQYLLLYENSSPDEDLTNMKSFDERHLHISVPLQNLSASAMKALFEKMNDELEAHYSHLSIELSGSQVLFNAQETHTSQGMAHSFGLAFFLIGICFFVLFRSFKYGLLALIPSVLPILFAGGVIYLLGIDLNLGTMIVGAITIGIAVDDSIHVMNRYIQAIRSGKTVHQSVKLALTESGRAVIFTSLILVSGFSLMLLGSFIPLIYTGIFSAIIMGLALICDLLLLPAVLYRLDGNQTH